LLRQVFGDHIADQEFILDKQQANRLSLIELSLVDVGAHYGIAPCVAIEMKCAAQKYVQGGEKLKEIVVYAQLRAAPKERQAEAGREWPAANLHSST
jgi:hypothetical protein